MEYTCKSPTSQRDILITDVISSFYNCRRGALNIFIVQSPNLNIGSNTICNLFAQSNICNFVSNKITLICSPSISFFRKWRLLKCESSLMRISDFRKLSDSRISNWSKVSNLKHSFWWNRWSLNRVSLQFTMTKSLFELWDNETCTLYIIWKMYNRKPCNLFYIWLWIQNISFVQLWHYLI